VRSARDLCFISWATRTCSVRWIKPYLKLDSSSIDDGKACHADIFPSYLACVRGNATPVTKLCHPHLRIQHLRNAMWLRNSSIGVVAGGWVALHWHIAVAMEPPPLATPTKERKWCFDVTHKRSKRQGDGFQVLRPLTPGKAMAFKCYVLWLPARRWLSSATSFDSRQGKAMDLIILVVHCIMVCCTPSITVFPLVSIVQLRKCMDPYTLHASILGKLFFVCVVIKVSTELGNIKLHNALVWS
jgi:hypothetical protein